MALKLPSLLSRSDPLQGARARALCAAGIFTVVFLAIGVRLFDFAVLRAAEDEGQGLSVRHSAAKIRAPILDRNGELLATSLPTVSLSANPREIRDRDPKRVARLLADTFPEVDQAALERELTSDKQFVWVERKVTPDQHYAINRLGIPGLMFQEHQYRFYPRRRTAAHVLGITNIDGKGLAGVEGYFDDLLAAGDTPLQLSLDVRVQHVVKEELAYAIDRFDALRGAAIVLDVRTGEVVALVSLPDFNPNDRTTMSGRATYNNAVSGAFEMGSTMKLITAAMALELGTGQLDTRYDATKPIHFAGFTIRDYHAQNKWLSMQEVLIHSSNIGAARMALDAGSVSQRAFLQQIGFLDALSLELPEVREPITPSPWREINTLTIAYGHGISITPLHLVTAVAALVNGGILYQPTLVRRAAGETIIGRRVVSEDTSKKVRMLMREVVESGTGKKADVPPYAVGGKTGTAEKVSGGKYSTHARLASFVAAFPIDEPAYAVLVLVDEPKGRKDTFNYATGGWVAAPAVGKIIERSAPLLGVQPRSADALEKVPFFRTVQDHIDRMENL